MMENGTLSLANNSEPIIDNALIAVQDLSGQMFDISLNNVSFFEVNQESKLVKLFMNKNHDSQIIATKDLYDQMIQIIE